ncbi:MAG: hypothetical protein FWE32_11870 [Oscillospiraceae bacterium]|nr:hypothetical protein [Oscillospiraceae bacterium]
MNKKHRRKMVAPILIIILSLFSFIPGIVAAVRIQVLYPFSVFLAAAIPLGVIVVSVIVLIERYKEIKGGEEDDLGNY